MIEGHGLGGLINLVGYVGHVVSAKSLENADTRHVGDIVVVVAFYDMTLSAPCQLAY